MRPAYFDCSASAPPEPEIVALVHSLMRQEAGNAASHTHEYGTTARSIVEHARSQIAEFLDARLSEIIFTSGATEANNLAILGLRNYARANHRLHFVTSCIEHKSVLQPFAQLEREGFRVSYVAPAQDGVVPSDAILNQITDDTCAVSIMEVNNELGTIQPIEDIGDKLQNSHVLFHVDGAQGFGKFIHPNRYATVDLYSISGHKACAPKGVGALLYRSKKAGRNALQPQMLGGGHENGLRSGTLPTYLIAGLGLAARIAERDFANRQEKVLEMKKQLLESLSGLPVAFNSNPDHTVPSCQSLRIKGVDADAVLLSLRPILAASTGSACTSDSPSPSHVLRALGFNESEISETIRLSWCHLTPAPDFSAMRQHIESLL